MMKGILCLGVAVLPVPSVAGPRGSCGQWAINPSPA